MVVLRVDVGIGLLPVVMIEADCLGYVFRLGRLVATGKPEHLAQIVAFVGDLADSGVRVKALDALVAAIGNRLVDEPAEWKSVRVVLAKDTNTDVQRLTNSLAVKFSDAEAIRKALAVAVDGKREVSERLNAIRDLGVAKSPATLQPLLDLRYIAFGIAGILLISFISGIYPALVLSGFNPMIE